MDIADERQGDGSQDGSSTPTPPCPPPHPPLLSINQLLALYPREPLQVRPLRWTDRQPALLGCRFHSHPAEIQSPASDENAGATASESDPRADRLARLLDGQLYPGGWIKVLNRLLAPLDGPLFYRIDQPVNLYFNRRARVRLWIRHLAVMIGPSELDVIALACLDYNETMLERKHYFRAGDNPRQLNWKGPRRSEILLKLHTPTDSQRDPILVALIIALAQRERKHATKPPPPNSSFTVHVLFTGEGRPKPVNLYIAHVQASFLERLDFPSQEPAVGSGLDINHWHLPAEPVRTLPDRVCQVLRLNGGGAARVENLGESSGEAAKKRKRDVASDEPASTRKKACH